LTIAEDPAFQSSFPFTQAKQLDVRVSLLRLLTGNVQVNSIDLDQPSVELIRDQQGKWNFASLSPAAPTAAPPAGQPPAGVPPAGQAPTPTAEPSKAPSGFSLGRLSITGGKIAVTDHFKNQPRKVYEPIDISLRDYREGQPFSFEVAAHIPGKDSQEIRIEGTGGPLPDADRQPCC
jgi:uncharacterized protein involved in outer membrane biogenesis